jgi:hypothetical protein
MPDRSQYYSSRGNCIRAARVALGKTAMLDTEFTLVENPEKKGHWAWKPTARSGLPTAESNREPDAPKAKRRRAPKGEKSNVLEQPAMKAAWSSAQVDGGITVAAGAKKTGSNKDTFRGKMSICRKLGCPITTTREGREISYHLAKSWHP